MTILYNRHFLLIAAMTLCCMLFFTAPAFAACLTKGCHDQGQDKLTLHPKGTDCQSCHVPLIDDHPRKAVKNFKFVHAPVCVKCHAAQADKKNPHVAIQEGKCLTCHNPHASAANDYLAKDYKNRPFIDYDKNAYALCFSCHKRQLLRFPDTSFATGFRDGEINLHYLHTNKEKNGRNCNLCHKVHESRQPKLIAEKVAFGKWQMPLHYIKEENGGSCTPGCHKTVKYDRNKIR